MLRILPHLLLAVSLFLTTVASTSVCSSAPYKDLLFLSSYAPAEILCSAVFPQPYITVTLTVGAAKAKRGGAHTNTKTTTTKHTTTTTKSPTSKSTTSTTPKSRCSECSVWSSCTAKGEAFLSTLCSCLEHPKTVTVRSSLGCFKPSPKADTVLYRLRSQRQSQRQRQRQPRPPPHLLAPTQ